MEFLEAPLVVNLPCYCTSAVSIFESRSVGKEVPWILTRFSGEIRCRILFPDYNRSDNLISFQCNFLDAVPRVDVRPQVFTELRCDVGKFLFLWPYDLGSSSVLASSVWAIIFILFTSSWWCFEDCFWNNRSCLVVFW
jgi:hypothetical protein